jgi:hypothetical protein
VVNRLLLMDDSALVRDDNKVIPLPQQGLPHPPPEIECPPETKQKKSKSKSKSKPLLPRVVATASMQSLEISPKGPPSADVKNHDAGSKEDEANHRTYPRQLFLTDEECGSRTLTKPLTLEHAAEHFER